MLKKKARQYEIGQLLEWACQELSSLGPEESKASSERLLEEVLGLERTFLYLNARDFVPAAVAARYRRYILKRKAHVPVAYLLKKSYFWNEVLEVQPCCLIPRPETEILVDSFIRHSGFQKKSSFSFLDLGTGTGAIGIALLRHYPDARAVFSDISRKALGVARRNLERYRLLGRAELICSDLFDQFRKRKIYWDAVISNPPYVPKSDWGTLEPELKFEPEIALAGGADGLNYYRKIIREAGQHLKSDGLLVFEMGAGQSNAIGNFMNQAGFKNKKVFKDYLGIDRVMMACAGLKA